MARLLAIALLLLFLQATVFPASAGDGAISISASASTDAPYQNQSVLYTVRVVARATVSNVSLNDPNVANAIVERQGEPQTRRSTENGAPVNLIDFHFIITPLRPGPAVIPPAVLKGETETSNGVDQFGGGFMAGMSRALNAISSLAGGQPFSVASNKTVLNVRSPDGALNPWLPLASLKITEDMPVAQSIRVGDLISRKITLSASGAVGSQLRDVEGQQNHTDFKVYTDKPTMGQTIEKTGVILALRTESFSLVPQHPGTLILPAVTISWWNVVTDTVATAELAQRTIKVLPSATAQGSGNDDANPARGQGMSRGSTTAPSKSPGGILNSRAGLLKALGTALIVSLLGIGGWWLSWRRKSARKGRGTVALGAMPRFRKAQRDTNGVVALKKVRGPEELNAFLQYYAREHWGAAKNASLEKIFAAGKVPEAGSEREDAEAIIEGVSAALYAGRPADIEDLKKRCQRVMMASKKKRMSLRKGGQKLACLNPD
jgi:hypothetical protein